MKIKKRQSLKKKTHIEKILLLWRTARVALIVCTFGVVLFASATVFAKSVLKIDWSFNDVVLQVSLRAPVTRAVVGKDMPISIYAVDASGIDRVELLLHQSDGQEVLQTLRGAGPTYNGTLDTTRFIDHSYQVVYAKAYANNGATIASSFTHIQVDRCAQGARCAKVLQGKTNANAFGQTLTGLAPGGTYVVSYDAKKASASALTLVVSAGSASTVIASCANEVRDYAWITSSACRFTMPSSSDGKATIRFSVGAINAPYSASEYLYVDNVRVTTDAGVQNLMQNPSLEVLNASWSYTGAEIVGVTPVTHIKPFDPSIITSVTSNLPVSESQNLGVHFFKGWPQAHYSWWSRLGIYERPSLYETPTGAYTYQQGATDTMGWYSPLSLFLSRETLNSTTFSYSDVRLQVQTNLGQMSICLPDLRWDSPLLNGSTVQSLLVDQYGNTYYAGKYSDPDLLTSEHLAKRCACDDGTRVGACNAARTATCQADGTFAASSSCMAKELIVEPL
ncbi:MAG: hypothetical protein Q8O51_02495 [bacterium]|nr:hypothetical protein [bacterium]